MTGQAGIDARQQACRAAMALEGRPRGLADNAGGSYGCARACQKRLCDASCPQPVLWPTGNTHLNVRKPGRLHQQSAWQSHLIEPARSSARLTSASMRYVTPRTSEKRLTTEAYPARSGAPAPARGCLGFPTQFCVGQRYALVAADDRGMNWCRAAVPIARGHALNAGVARPTG